MHHHYLDIRVTLTADKLRAQAALALIGLARRLLKLQATASADFDTCVYCKATGCEDGTVEHAPECPSLTGIYPVTLQEMWPAGPAQCAHCGSTLWPGDSYSHIPVTDDLGTPVVEVACTGCAVLAGLEA